MNYVQRVSAEPLRAFAFLAPVGLYPLEKPQMSKIREFLLVFNLYRKHHSMRYAVRIAYGCAFRGLPF